MSTPALSTAVSISSADEPLLSLEEQISDGCGSGAAAGAAAAALLRELRCTEVCVYRIDPESRCLVLLAAAPDQRHGPALGSRLHQPGGTLGVALRSGEVQRAANTYVEPDFVRKLPGETRSELAVPIGPADDLLGVIHLEYAPPRQPGKRDEEIARDASSQLAIAFAADESDAPAESQRGAALATLCHVIAQDDDVRGALQRVLESARELTGCEAAVLLTRHHARQMLEVVALAGTVPCGVGDLFPIHDGIAGEVLRGGQPRIHTRAEDASLFGGGSPPVSGALLVPVATSGKTVGVLAVLNRADGSGFSREDVETALCLASYAGATESARQVALLRQRLSDASTIAEVGRAMTGTLGVDDVLALVVRAAEMLASGRGVALGLVSDNHLEMTLASTSGVLARAQGQTVSAQESVMGFSALMGEVVISPCVSDDPRGYPHEVRQGPAVIVPLESRGKPSGALMVTRADGAPLPSEEDVDALRKLAAYAAIAIDNARLYREQTELSRALRAQAEELERAYAELRESQEQLVISEKMAALGRLTAGIAHEINSPLGGIMNCLQLALQYASEYQSSVGDPDVTPEDHRAIAKDLIETITMAEGATRKVGQFVRTIKGQTRTGDESARQPFDPAEEIQGTLTLLQHEVRNRQVTLHTEAERGQRLVGDPGKFALIVQNLVSNAIDAYEGEAGEVWIRLRREGQALVLEVEDRGCGIPDAIRGRIFDYLFTTKDIGQGTGLGLSIVHSIITTHFQGSIDLRSEVGVGTTFAIRFPASDRSE